MRFLFAAILALSFAVPGWTISLKKDASRKRAPDFELTDASGSTHRLSDYAGKVVLIDFWATWCAPCKSSIPWISELARQYKEDGLVVLGLSVDEEGWPVVKPFVERLGVPYPILLATKRVAYLYGDVDALPVAFFIDRNQRVAAIHLGPGTRKEFEKTIKMLLGVPH